MTTFQQFAPNEKIVALTIYNGMVVIATDKSLYTVRDKELRELEFVVGEPIMVEHIPELK